MNIGIQFPFFKLLIHSNRYTFTRKNLWCLISETLREENTSMGLLKLPFSYISRLLLSP